MFLGKELLHKRCVFIASRFYETFSKIPKNELMGICNS